MKTWITKGTKAVVVLVALAFPADLAAQSYTVVRLAGLGGGAGANGINDRGWTTGTANSQGDALSHAALWTRDGQPIDLGSLGGPDLNSAVAWPMKSNNGVIVGVSQPGSSRVAFTRRLPPELRWRGADSSGRHE